MFFFDFLFNICFRKRQINNKVLPEYVYILGRVQPKPKLRRTLVLNRTPTYHIPTHIISAEAQKGI